MMRQTELAASSVLEDALVGRVEADTPHHIAELRAVHHPVATVPEVEQIKHVSHI